jgi:hypothetical protein
VCLVRHGSKRIGLARSMSEITPRAYPFSQTRTGESARNPAPLANVMLERRAYMTVELVAWDTSYKTRLSLTLPAREGKPRRPIFVIADKRALRELIAVLKRADELIDE